MVRKTCAIYVEFKNLLYEWQMDECNSDYQKKCCLNGDVTDILEYTLNKYNIPENDYITETRQIEEPDPDNPGKTVVKEKKYIKWFGCTVKIYQIYYKK
jgi:hypothetical protein